MRALITFILLTISCAGRVYAYDDSTDWRADVYASPKSALAALANETVRVLSGQKEFDPQTSRITIVNDFDSATSTAVRIEFPATKIENASAEEKLQPGTLAIRIQLKDAQRPGAVWASSDLEAGTLSATIFSGSDAQRPTTIAVKFVDKPWADDWSSFVNREHAKKWMMAESPRPCVSEREADEEARRAAALALWQPVVEQLKANATGKRSILVAQEFVVGQIETQLQRNVGIADQFVQRFDRPYGRVWHKMLLLDGSKSTIDTLARNIAARARADYAQKQRDRFWSFGSTGALAVVILLLYFFVNAVTKGYFVWRLRAAALLLAIVGIIVAMSLK